MRPPMSELRATWQEAAGTAGAVSAAYEVALQRGLRRQAIVQNDRRVKPQCSEKTPKRALRVALINESIDHRRAPTME
ncbi:unnamed protein product [Lampetra fluviatilis]